MSGNPCDFPGMGCSKSSNLNEAFADTQLPYGLSEGEEKAAARMESVQEHALSYILEEETALNKKEDAGNISSSWNSLSTELLSFFKGTPLTKKNLQNYFSEVLIGLRSSLVSQSDRSLHLWLFQYSFLFFTKSFSAVAEATALQRPTSTSSSHKCSLALRSMWPQHSEPTSRNKIILYYSQEAFWRVMAHGFTCQCLVGLEASGVYLVLWSSWEAAAVLLLAVCFWGAFFAVFE